MRPDQVVDVLALMGDSIDNIKGVPGIGEKGARELIATHGTLDALLEAAPTITQKRYREGLLAHADDARMSRELARIRTDVPVTFDPDALAVRGAVARAVLRAVFVARLPDARRRVRADGGNDARATTSVAHVDRRGRRARAGAGGGDAIGIAAIAADTSAVRADVVGWAFSPAPGSARVRPARALRTHGHAEPAGPRRCSRASGRCWRTRRSARSATT